MIKINILISTEAREIIEEFKKKNSIKTLDEAVDKFIINNKNA